MKFLRIALIALAVLITVPVILVQAIGQDLRSLSAAARATTRPASRGSVREAGGRFRDLFDFPFSYPAWDARGRAAATVLFTVIFRPVTPPKVALSGMF